MSLWSSMGTLDQYMDMSGVMTMAHSYIAGIVFTYWDDATYGPRYTVWFADLIALCMTFVGAAYVIVKTVDAGVHTANGFYFNYGAWATITDNLGVWELLVLGSLLLWALTTTIIGLVGASMVWD